MAIALAVVAEPWILPEFVGGLFFRWHAAAVGAIAALLLGAAIAGRLLAKLPIEHRLLAMVTFSLQVMSLRVGPLNLLNLTIVLLVLWWIVDFAKTAHEPRNTGLLTHLLVLYGVLAMVSVFGEQQSPRGLIVLLPKLVMALILIRLLGTEANVRFALRVLVFGALFSACLGVLQSAAYVFLGLELHRMEDDSPRFIVVFGLNMLRSAGLLPNPQAYCHVVTVGLLLLSYRWLADGAGHRRWNPFVCGSLLLLLAAVVLSFARGPWATAAVGLVLLPAAVWPRHAFHWFVALGVLALVGVWTGGLTAALGAYRSFTLSNAEVRVELLAAGFDVLAQHPWRGVGLANFEFYSPTPERYPVHNTLMQLATEVGLPALLVYSAMLALPVVRAVRALRIARGAAAHRLRATLLAYFIYMITIQGEPSAYSELLLFFVVLLDAVGRTAVSAQPQVPRAPDVLFARGAS